MRTLVLDNSFYPVSIVNWQKAMILLVTGRATVVKSYEEVFIRSIRDEYNLPQILKLMGTFKRHIEVKFSRFNVYWRDKWTCQYCNERYPKDQLTFDHVMPRCRGGETDWSNVVTCCKDCNCKKGGRLLKDTNFKLKKEPKKPRWVPQMHLRITEDDPEDWTHWIPEKLYAC
ncbi:MAG: HNH endonuclease [Bacteriovoracaceae bacterium]|jgi:5-methylcytosine-specific restriction endonuclease McrA|nr:HNH endonuclease [Bacteriovoracaceae bacterium]